MKTALALAVLTLSWTTAALAQTQAPPTTSSWLRGAHTNIRGYIARAAEKMPEELYAMRPGKQPEVRTFGQLIGHLATYNYLWCSQAKGEANPNAGRALEKELKTKAEFVKAVTAAFAYCDPAYAALTDPSGAEVLTITQENGNKQQQTRLGLLMLNVVHSNEVYGSMVTTLRIKNISPQPAASK
jgi:uncharacterized damage-inducible protein DinB